MKKKLILSVVVLASCAAGLNAKVADKPLNIAFVDSFEAMRECEEGQKVGREIDAMRDKASAQIKAEAEKLAQADSDLKAKASTLNQQVLAKKGRELEKQRRDLEERVREEEEAIKIAMQQKTEVLATQVEAGIVSVAKERGVDAVIDKMTGRVMYTKDADNGDITKDAIARVNTEAKTLAQSKGAQATTTA
jgi:Skp family chaperone for outer membrane proteins